MTGGSVRTQAWSMLYGGQLSGALSEFRKDYDVVIIDTPPVLAVADSRLLCRQSDGVVLVCRAGTTDRESARSAVERLTSDGARLYGTILNDFDPRSSRYYKNYYAYDEASRTQPVDRRKSRPA
jgi:Mrp family chromosome partitioning ATPase